MKKLNKQTRQALAYAQDALSFIFLDPSAEFIETIYLYGSAVRGQLQKESDIDLFIDTERDIEKQVNAAIGRYYISQDYEKWKHLGFTPQISIQTGKLEEWQLKISISAEGLLLYSKKGGKAYTERFDLFILELPKNKKKYLHFIRSFFGRKEPGYRDGGFLSKLQGEKLSSNVVLIKKEHEAELLKWLQKEKVNYSFKEISVF